MLSDSAIDDIERSGITTKDINARPLTSAELSAVGYSMSGVVPDGYTIPYFNLSGDPEPYYRVKFLGVGFKGQKYRGVAGENAQIYFPPRLPFLLEKHPDYIIITEGEKKAASAVANGFPAVGLGGVDSWRSRNIIIPDTTELTPLPGRKMIKARLPAGDTHSLLTSETGATAEGFEELVELIQSRNLTVIIIFDTDAEGVKPEVQRAAATLGYELRYRGISVKKIRQLILPKLKSETKLGLDDFLVSRGADALASGIKRNRTKRSAFPQHPNPKSFLASKLQSGRLSRKEIQDISLALMMELEANGRRLRNIDTKDFFYFDEKTHVLMQVILNNPKVALHDTEFGAYLYDRYNIAAADQRLIQWLAAQFTGEPGVAETQTHKVLTRHPTRANQIAYQLSNTHFILIRDDPNAPYEICENGTHGILFEQNQVLPLDTTKLRSLIDRSIDDEPEPLWHTVIDGFNFTVDVDVPVSRMSADVVQSKMLASLIFYASPWLHRWRGTQLPVELVVGEAGSGKSSLYGLRQEILTGQSRLSNTTKDIKDWYAGITSRGGIYVLDNVKFTGSDKDYQQRLSDEICRLITEPDPRVEVRKLYTTSDIASMPVSCSFAVTSVAQPFFNIDILQRAAIFEMQSLSSTGTHDANWSKRQLDMGGGRLGWIAHHIIVIHKFLRMAIWENKWNDNFGAGHRLANYEQSLMLMARVFGLDDAWIPGALKLRTEHSVTETDWNLAGIKEFITTWKEKYPTDFEKRDFSSNDIMQWALNHDAFAKNQVLTNSWRLGKYLKSNIAMIKGAMGLYESGKKQNKTVYSIYRRPDDVGNK